MTRFFCIFVFLLFPLSLSCAPSLDRSLLTREGPQIVSVSPNVGARVGLVESVEVRFSEPILETTVTEKSFMIARLPEGDSSLVQGGAAANFPGPEDTEKQSGSLTVTPDRFQAIWEPSEPLPAGVYQVILLPLIKSVTHRPLNDTGLSGTQPFVSWFVVEEAGLNGADSQPTGNDNAGSLSESDETDDPENDATGNDVVLGEGEEEPELAEDLLPSENGVVEPDTGVAGRSGMIITEVVTDPQRDWNDSSGGNGILFDSISGTGTIGSSDEWIELSNRSEDPVSLKDWRIEMIDGSDATEVFSQPASTFQFSPGGSLDSVLPGEFLVIGNPPGDMKNTLLLRLIDNEETVVDEVNIEDANASGIFDETYQWNDDEGWKMGEASIGF